MSKKRGPRKRIKGPHTNKGVHEFSLISLRGNCYHPVGLRCTNCFKRCPPLGGFVLIRVNSWTKSSIRGQNLQSVDQTFNSWTQPSIRGPILLIRGQNPFNPWTKPLIRGPNLHFTESLVSIFFLQKKFTIFALVKI